MAVYPATVEATFNSMRERALRLEQEAAALRSDLDEMEILVQWQASHSISSEALRRIAVSDTEIALYQNQSAEKFSSSVLRAVFQAHQAATRLKLSLPQPERRTAIQAVIEAFHRIAAEDQLIVPDELEAIIGD